MFTSRRNPAAQYKAVEVESEALRNDPHSLITLLFDAAITATFLAKQEMENGNIAKKGIAISKAIDVIDNGLKAALNFDEGGDIAIKLASLYDYLGTRLLHANLKNDTAALDEVGRLLSEIRSAWLEIGSRPVASPAADNDRA